LVKLKYDWIKFEGGRLIKEKLVLKKGKIALKHSNTYIINYLYNSFNKEQTLYKKGTYTKLKCHITRNL
jgi:hypothetical protein